MKLNISFAFVTVILMPYVLSDNDNNKAISAARKLVKNFLNSTANGLTPGLVIGVSVKGKHKWLEGFGLANIENHVAMRRNVAMDPFPSRSHLH